MSQDDVTALFAKVGASAATAEATKESVGEFGIGVISYFMAGDVFTLQTSDGITSSIGLSFSREMLAGGTATTLPPTLQLQGTSITIHLRDVATFDLLLDRFPHWCRDVVGLSAQVLPEGCPLQQLGTHGQGAILNIGALQRAACEQPPAGAGLLRIVETLLDPRNATTQRCESVDELEQMASTLPPSTLRRLLDDDDSTVARYSLGLIPASPLVTELIDHASRSRHASDEDFRTDLGLLRRIVGAESRS